MVEANQKVSLKLVMCQKDVKVMPERSVITDTTQWPVRLEIKRHIAPPDKWHWCVIFNGGHIYAISETFDSAEMCVADAYGAGLDALRGAEFCLTHNV